MKLDTRTNIVLILLATLVILCIVLAKNSFMPVGVKAGSANTVHESSDIGPPDTGDRWAGYSNTDLAVAGNTNSAALRELRARRRAERAGASTASDKGGGITACRCGGRSDGGVSSFVYSAACCR